MPDERLTVDEIKRFNEQYGHGQKLDIEQLHNLKFAQAAAKKYGVPESVLVGTLLAENEFHTAGGNGGGPGQMLETTAHDYKITQEIAREHPDLGIDAAAHLLADNAKMFKGDYQKAQAAYFVGPGTIQAALQGPNGEKNWVVNADAIARKNNWGSLVDYLGKTGTFTHTSTGRETAFGKTGDQILSENGLSPVGAGGGSNGSTWTDATKMPQPGQFQTDDGTGVRSLDTKAYSEAMTAYAASLQARKAEREYNTGPLSQYVDDIIAEMAQGIQTGQLSLSKANSLLKARTDTYKMGLDALEGNAFKFGTAPGAQYVQGREPGGFWESRGLPPLAAQQGNTVDPLKQAFDLARQSESEINAVQVPQPQSIADTRWAATGTAPAPPPAQLTTHAPEIPGANNVNIQPPGVAPNGTIPVDPYVQALMARTASR